MVFERLEDEHCVREMGEDIDAVDGGKAKMAAAPGAEVEEGAGAGEARCIESRGEDGAG